MSDGYDVSGHPPDRLRRLQAALTELVLCLDETHAYQPHAVQLNDLLDLWDALPTYEGREEALSALRGLTIRYRQ